MNERLLREISGGAYDRDLAALYGEDKAVLQRQRTRYARTVELFGKRFGQREDIVLYSVPGRAELCGNHTDHNCGVVLASAVNLDIIAAVAPTDDGKIVVNSQGHGSDMKVDLNDLVPRPSEQGSSIAMVRGVASGFAERGGRVGGFLACTHSDVLKGSGLSSSAAFEVLIAAIINGESNDNRFSPVECAQIARRAENLYFGKPCGLMDQISCAMGGVVFIDFKDSDNPLVRSVPFNPEKWGYRMVMTDTKESHSRLTGEYAAIRKEMEAVAAFFGASRLRDVSFREFFSRLGEVRTAVGDRACLRALHFFAECDRVVAMEEAARAGDIRGFLEIIVASGRSSFQYNQNAYCPATPSRQGISLALAISEQVLGRDGAWRLMGGGFAGAIQAFVPDAALNVYRQALSSVFGQDASRVLSLRKDGPRRLRSAK